MGWEVTTVAYGGNYWENARFGPFLPEGDDGDDGRKAAERFVQARRDEYAASGYIGDPGYVVPTGRF